MANNQENQMYDENDTKKIKELEKLDDHKLTARLVFELNKFNKRNELNGANTPSDTPNKSASSSGAKTAKRIARRNIFLTVIGGLGGAAVIAAPIACCVRCSSKSPYEDNSPVPVKISHNGTVLLRNQEKNGSKALPLSQEEKENKTIHMFGFGSCDKGWYFQGNGSGRGPETNQVFLGQALQENGFKINEKLLSDYNNLSISNRVGVTEDPRTNYTIRETKTEFVQQEINAITDKSNGIALFVVSRYGGEGNDLPKFQSKQIDNGLGGCDESIDTTRIYSQLSQEEEASLKLIGNAGFSKVIVLLNNCCVMECGFLEDEEFNVDAAFYMPPGGSSGTLAIPHLLDGTITPSGHLADTIAYKLNTAPSYYNMSWENSFDDPDRRVPRTFSDYDLCFTAYEENIYIGYYWYETADKMGFWNDKGGYDKIVQYPFGYGLSYTDFKWEFAEGYPLLKSGNRMNMTIDDEITCKVKVTNTGDYRGRDVVQLYVQKPYTEGGIEKPAVQLIGFAKTKILEPGESEIVAIKSRISDFADYDCYDKNNDGFMGYELEKGSYSFSLRTDAHTVAKNNHGDLVYEASINLNSPSLQSYHYEKDVDTGYEVKNRFTTYTNAESGATSTNSDRRRVGAWCGSMDGNDVGTHTEDGGEVPGIGAHYMTRNNLVMPEHLLDRPKLTQEHYHQTYEDITFEPLKDYVGTLRPQEQKNGLTIEDVKGLSYDDQKWDLLLDEMSYDEMKKLVCEKDNWSDRNSGGFHVPLVETIRKPKTHESDGPCGFGSSHKEGGIPICFPSDTMVACTWDYDLARQFGVAIAQNGLEMDWEGNYGSGANIHRSPLGGRNFEYYSEDPFLTGTMASWHVSGAKSEGMFCYVKHIAMNDSDTIRNGRYIFGTEQALRQIYAKPFEIIAKGARAFDADGNELHALKGNAYMASVDRIGTTRVTGSYAFLTEVVRNEWGFRGSIITDYYQSGYVNDVDEGIRSGNDLMLNHAFEDKPGAEADFMDLSSPTYFYYLRQSAKNILWTYIDTKYCSEMY